MGLGIIGWIVIGIAAGWLAEMVMGRSHGLVTNLIVGVVGALLGGWIAGNLLGEPVGGFGLGLSIVRRICNVLGHPLIVTTRPGSGTVFRVETPLSALPHRGPRPPMEIE
jgi:uncharacterized membrane protein YeaQ/YmgE (transglycosylase-associated protein family)